MWKMDTAEDRLMGYGEPRYDQSAKNILSDKSILAHILKSTVSEFKDASIEDIANVYIEGTPEVSRIPLNQDKTNAVTKKIQGDRMRNRALPKAGSLLTSFSTPKPRNPVTSSPLSLTWKPRKRRKPPPLVTTY